MTPGRKTLVYEPQNFGRFSFHPLAVNAGGFLELVQREQLIQQTMLVATPFRALMDLVCLRKTEWQGMAYLTEGLRIDEEYLYSIAHDDIETLMLVYKQKRVRLFLDSLARALDHD